VQRKPKTKLKGALSVKARAKHKVSMKSKLPGAYIRRKKLKGKTHQVSKVSIEDIQTLSLSFMGNPPSLAIPLFLAFSHPTPSSIHISP